MLNIEFSNRQLSLTIDTGTWRQMLAHLFSSEGIRRGNISVSIVQDTEMHALNRTYLDHDYPTDVLSFILDRQEDELEGEIIVSADTAIARCQEFGWQPHEELTLYLIHGALHLVGYDDKSVVDCQMMRERESHYLERFGLSASQWPQSKADTEDSGNANATPDSKVSSG